MLPFSGELKQVLEDLKGRAGLAIEIDNDCFYFNHEEVFPSASVIKVPILMEALRQAESGSIDVNESVQIRHRVGGSGILQVLSDQVVVTVKDLMTLMITVSDNTATNMMIDLLGMDAINTSIESMGMQKTVLQRKMTDFAAIERGINNLTSPADIITCLKVLDQGDFLTEESRKLALEIMHAQQFHDKLSAMIDPEAIFVAGKTGSLPQVENDCAVFKWGNKTAYVAVLMDQLEDSYSGRQVISKVGKYIYDSLIA